MSDFMIRNFYKQRKDFEKSSAERNLTLTFPDTVTEIKKHSLYDRRLCRKRQHFFGHGLPTAKQ